MSPGFRIVTALLLSGLAACGGRSNYDDGDPSPGGSGQGGESGAKAAGGSSRGGTGAGGKGTAGSAGAGGISECTIFDDDPATFVRVSILNKTSAPIYLGQDMVTCGVSPLFQVADARGVVLPDLGDCRSSCVSLRTQGVGGCPAICAFPSSVALQPGEVLNTSWDGLFHVQGELPSKCSAYDTGEAFLRCDQAKGIQPGTFTFSARAGRSVDCSQTSGTGTCSPCNRDANGGCSIPGSLISGSFLSAASTVELNEAYGVYGSPSGSPAGASDAPGIMAVLTVELVFTE